MTMGSSRPVGRLALAAVFVVVTVGALSSVSATGVSADGGNVTVYRVVDANADDSVDVRTAIATGSIEPATEAVVGETLVVAIDSDRLAAKMDARNGSPTERFFAVLDGDASFRIAQTNPTVERPRKLARVGPENVTVHRAGSTTYVLVDTGALRLHFRGDEERPADIRDGDRFAVTFGHDLDEHETSGPEVALYAVEAEVLTRYRPEPLRPDVVNRSVRVNVQPDEALFARLTLDGGRTTTVPVQPTDRTGYHRVSLELGDVEPGTGYTLELVHDGTVVDRFEGTVSKPRGRVADATLTEVRTEHLVTRSGSRVTETVDDHVAVNATVTLSHGGQVRVLDGTCERVGSEWVEPGVETRLSIDLWRDGKPMRARNLTDGGFVVRAFRDAGSGMVRYSGPGAEATVGTDADGCQSAPGTPSGGSSGDSTSTGTDDATPSPGTTLSTPGEGGAGAETGNGTGTVGPTASPGQPGFAVPATLVALLVVAIGRRRR